MSTRRTAGKWLNVSYAFEREQREMEITFKLQAIKNRFEKRSLNRKIPPTKDRKVIKDNRALLLLLFLSVDNKVDELKQHIIVPQELYEEVYILFEVLLDVESAIYEYLTNDET